MDAELLTGPDREPARRYQDFFEFSSDGHVVTDVPGIIQDANRTTTVLLNKVRDLLVGKPLLGFVLEADRETLRAQLARLAQEQPVQECEVRLQPRGGLPCPVAVTGEAVRDAEGNVRSLRWSLRDITERWLAQEALRESDDLVGTLFQHSHDAIFIIEPARGKILGANPQACRMLGYSSGQVLAMPFSDVCQNDVADLLKCTAASSPQVNGWKGVLTFVTHSIQLLPLEATFTSVNVAGRSCLIVLARDAAGRAPVDTPGGDTPAAGSSPFAPPAGNKR